MRETVGDGKPSVLREVRSIHGLQQKVIERQALELNRPKCTLREHELELVARHLVELRAGFRADTDPIDFARHWESAVRLDSYAKALAVQSANEWSVDL